MSSDDASPHTPPRKKGGRFKNRLAAYGILYLIFLTFSMSCHLTDQLVLIPTTHKINHRAHTMMLSYAHGELEVLRVDSRKVDPHLGPEAYVLSFTGNGTRAEEIAEWMADVWQKKSVQVWTVNYPGYGKSTGPARLRAVAAGALASYDALRQEANAKPIFVVGNSLGTTAALHIAANRTDVAGLFLTNPPALRQVILGHGWWNLWLIALPVSWGVPSELDSIANATRSHAPAVILMSERDEVVKVKYQRMVANAYAGESRQHIRDGGHNDAFEGKESAWLAEQIDWLWSKASKTSQESAATTQALDSASEAR